VSGRAYPDRPFVGVGAVVVDDRGRVLLVERRFEPLAGQWSLPGGGVDVGETLEACVIREMREETGLDVEVGPVIDVFDRIMHDAEGRVQYHYVLVDYVCRPVGGTLMAASDVAGVAWVEPSALAGFNLTDKAMAVIGQGFSLAAAAGWTIGGAEATPGASRSERSDVTSRKGI
jgi:ADP-ribose pyrophosphatase YjhB (NUDIX family)